VYKVLFVTSECWPLVKTGGLADVSSSLPLALQAQGLDVVTLLPAYRGVKSGFKKLKKLGSINSDYCAETIELFEGIVEISGQKIWLVDAPSLYRVKADLTLIRQKRNGATTAIVLRCFVA